VWLIGAMVCLLAAPWVQLSVCAGNGWPHNALRHHWLMPISCHFRDCNALLVTSLTHVSGAVATVQTFTNKRLNLVHTSHTITSWWAARLTEQTFDGFLYGLVWGVVQIYGVNALRSPSPRELRARTLNV